MRGIRAAVLVCLGAWAACSFRSPGPNGGGDDGDDSGSAVMDAPAVDALPADAPRCLIDGTYQVSAVTGRRYKALTATVNYDTAIDLCTADGAHLAVVNDAVENTALTGILNAAGGGEAWLGFDDLTVEGVFKWVTGVTGVNLYTGGEPNNVNNEDCTALRIDGTWHDQGCENDKRPLCECDPTYRPPPTPTCRGLTANSFERSGRRVFRGPAATWADAKAACSAMGAHLLVIGDMAKNDEMDQSLAGAFWLGYTDAVTEGQFAWVTESPATYNRWPGGTVPANDAEDCAVLQDGGAWADLDCTTMNAYACECDPLPP